MLAIEISDQYGAAHGNVDDVFLFLLKQGERKIIVGSKSFDPFNINIGEFIANFSW